MAQIIFGSDTEDILVATASPLLGNKLRQEMSEVTT